MGYDILQKRNKDIENTNKMTFYLRSKIHMATVTQVKVNYIGSIAIDKALIEKVGFEEGDKVIIAGFELSD